MAAGVSVMMSDDVQWLPLTRPDDPSQVQFRGCQPDQSTVETASRAHF